MKKLWMLELTTGENYDCMTSCVIRSETPIAARHFAAEHAGDEGRDVWLDPSESSITELTPFGPVGVVQRSFSR